MKRVAAALVALAGAVLLWIAAPALSLRPYQPDPVDFELGGPQRAGPGATAAGHGFVSRPQRTPKRFNLVGLRWRGHRSRPIHLAVRTREDGGRWSRWSPLEADTDDAPDPGSREDRGLAVSSPEWVGQADWVQYRSSAPLPGVRLHFVNTTGTATAADRAETAIRHAAHDGFVALAGIANAGAAESQPAIVSRAGWGAADCPPRSPPQYGQIKVAFVHHTVNANDYTRAEAPSIVLAICRFHRNSNGWDDIGYNFLVDRFGTLYEGRAGGMTKPVIGAQVAGYNSESFGVSNIGTFSSVPQTHEAIDAMARLIRWKLALHGVPSRGTVTIHSSSGAARTVLRISGHRDANNTECPGDALYAQLPQLRDKVGNVTPGAPSAASDLTLKLKPVRVRYPNSTRAIARLTASGGHAIDGRLVTIEVRKRGGWSRVAKRRTGSDGRVQASLKPAGRRMLRARFAGGGGTESATSPSVFVDVRPVVDAKLVSARVRVGQAAVLAGRVRPAKSRVLVVVQREAGAAPKQVAVLTVRTRGGRLRSVFHPKRAGRYRLYAVSPHDGVTLRAQSQPVALKVAKANGAVRAAR